MTVASSLPAREHSSVDITSHRFWAQTFDQRDQTFAELRAADGLTWHRPLPSLFASFFLTTDPPQHTVYRRLISSAFTPRNVRRIEEQIHDTAVAVVDDLVKAAEIDFVSACSARLPMLTIMKMLGVPPSEQSGVAKAAEKLFNMSDDEYSSLEERAADTINEIMLLSSTGVELAKFRRNNPGDDLMTSIVNAEVDGQRLTDEEIGSFLILLTSAADDTTKQATTHAMMALVANPEQREWLMRTSRTGSLWQERNSSDGHRRSCSSPGMLSWTPKSRGSRSGRATNWGCSTVPRTGTIEFGEPDLLHGNFVHGVKRLPAVVE